MGTTNFRASLEKRYAALTGELEALNANIDRIRREAEVLVVLEQKIPKLEALIASAEMLLRDANPAWEPIETPPVQPWTHQLPIPFGSCGRRGMEVLRLSGKPMTAREIAVEVLRNVGAENAESKTIQRTVNAVEASLRKHRGRTVESSGKYPAQWRAINKPGVVFDP